jgi:hypothetical protein
MSGKAGKRAAHQFIDEKRPRPPAPEATDPGAAGEAEPKAMPTSDRMAVETAHHHPAHDGGARNDGAPGPAPSTDHPAKAG